MDKGVLLNHEKQAIYLPSREKKDSASERCIKSSLPTRRPKFLIIIYAIMVVFVFVAGLVIGYFTKSDVCSSVNEHEDDLNMLELLLESLNKENMKRIQREFSSQPHLSGSQRSKQLAEEIKTKWDSYGFHVDTVDYDVYLPRANNGSPDHIEIRNSTGNVIMRHNFEAVGKSDPSSNKEWTIPRYMFYSPPGSVQGGLFYVHEGTKENFEELKKMNITSCNGSVVLIKLTKFDALPMLKNAHECNASAVLLFRENFAKWQTTGKGQAYPNGVKLPEEQPQVLSMTHHWMVGDVFTPGLPSKDGIYRVGAKDADLPAKLPVQIIELEVAKRLLKQLDGSPVPEQWKSKSKEIQLKDYRIGPSLINNSVFHLSINSRARTTKIFDVIGTVYGQEDPDDWVLVGNHRDAISFGAMDAGSGMAAIMELSRAIGELVKKGWKPRRTIKLCSWAAEEPGIVGATEYVEDNRKLLQERAIAYINMDMLVHGNVSLKASGNPMLAELVYSETKKIKDPSGSNESVYTVWKKMKPGARDKPAFTTIGLGSDYIPFYEIVGVPSIDLQYMSDGSARAYHTVYDTYHMLSMFDPHFNFHLAQTKLAARIVFSLANSLLIPFNINTFSTTLKEILNRTRNAYDKKLEQHGITLNELAKEVIALEKAGKGFEKIKSASNLETKKDVVRQLNGRMKAFNKIFISPEPMPERLSMRNLVLGISQNNFYPNITFAGISDAILEATTSGRWEIVKRRVSLTHNAISQARRSLEMP